MIDRNGVDWLLFGVPERSVEGVNSVRDEERRDRPRPRTGVIKPGVECFPGVALSDGAMEGANDVNSDPVSISAVSSISPSAGMSFASANGTLSSSSSSSSSLSSLSSGFVTA